MSENRMDGLTLDQMAIFVAVVEEGSFSGAARRLNRAQSAVTYGIQNLELQTGTDLFDRSAYRPSLSAAGAALLPQARLVLESLVAYRKKANALTAGTEARLVLAVDVVSPQKFLIEALAAFAHSFPTVELSIITQPMEQTAALLKQGEANLGVIIDLPIPGLLDGLERSPCASFQFVTVAAPGHPLAKMERPLSAEQLRDHMQLLISAGSSDSGTSDYSAHAINRWRVNNLAMRHSMLLDGLGWGGMPDHMVAEDIKAGRLVALPLDKADSMHVYPRWLISVAYLKTRMLGPAGRWLLNRVSSQYQNSITSNEG